VPTRTYVPPFFIIVIKKEDAMEKITLRRAHKLGSLINKRISAEIENLHTRVPFASHNAPFSEFYVKYRDNYNKKKDTIISLMTILNSIRSDIGRVNNIISNSCGKSINDVLNERAHVQKIIDLYEGSLFSQSSVTPYDEADVVARYKVYQDAQNRNTGSTFSFNHVSSVFTEKELQEMMTIIQSNRNQLASIDDRLVELNSLHSICISDADVEYLTSVILW
jgi:hypothetical protein